MKVLITGGCGFVGTNISIFLKKKGYNVTSLDNLSRKGSKYNLSILKTRNIKNYNIDISIYHKIKKLPKFDLIIDCCAEASVEVSKKEIDRVINTNLIGTINILKKIMTDNSKIIFLSSSRVYDLQQINKTFKLNKRKSFLENKKFIDENFSIHGVKSIYGLTKLSSEMFIKEFSYISKIKYIINRCGVLSGPFQFGKQDQGFVSHWIWSHITRKNLSYIGYNGSGEQIRDVLHIDDLCELIFIQIKQINKNYNLIFNVGGSNKCFISLKQLTKICTKITGNNIKFKKIKNTSIYDIPYYITDNRKISSFYNWSPKKNINNVVKDTYNWLISNKSKIKKYL